MSCPIVVTAAVVEHEGCFLLTRRLAGTHLAGCWEFPGGKCEPGEPHAEALERELHEELAVSIAVGRLILSTTHAYADRTVELHFYEARLLGMPVPQLGQEMRWVAREDLAAIDFPEADATLIRLLAGHLAPAPTSRPDARQP
jgi:8-oxo-dGTP diphosphatase